MRKHKSIFATLSLLSILLLLISSCATEEHQNSHDKDKDEAIVTSIKTDLDNKESNITPESKETPVSFSLPGLDADDEAENLIRDEEREDILKRAEQLLQQKN